MDKYRYKQQEAQQLADFLIRILQWHPKDRASAQTMLDHPWLSMSDNYDYKMNEIEFKKYKFKQTFEGVNNEFLQGDRNSSSLPKKQDHYQDFCPGARVFNCKVSELESSDESINGGDCEDNISDLSSMDSSTESERSLTNGKDQLADEYTLNHSFTGGYVPNQDLVRVDKGQGNPQFSGLEIKV